MPIWGFSSVTVTPARGFAEASYTVPYNVAFCEAAKAVAAHSRRTEHRNVNLNILLISPPKGFTPNCKWCNHGKRHDRKRTRSLRSNEDCVGPVSLKNFA